MSLSKIRLVSDDDDDDDDDDDYYDDDILIYVDNFFATFYVSDV